MLVSSATMRELDPGTEHERVVVCRDPSADYHGIIAIHSTALGPAVGGVRLWSYESEEEALTDALRLSRGMTYKNALAGLPLGGGKSVIIGDPRAVDRESLFRAHGRFVERFGGRYITAEDVGTGVDDMEYVRTETDHVAGLADRSGDPSPFTARGVVRAMQAVAEWRWGTAELSGRTVAVQGLGHVGHHLVRALSRHGARLIVTDVAPARVEKEVQELGVQAVEPDAIYDADADIFAPCALGGVINDATIPRLRVAIVAGAANNQLLEPRHGDLLAARGIVYAPDYVANSGGIISGCRELLGWDTATMESRLEGIYESVRELLRIAGAEGITPHRAADELAERRLEMVS